MTSNQITLVSSIGATENSIDLQMRLLHSAYSNNEGMAKSEGGALYFLKFYDLKPFILETSVIFLQQMLSF